MYDGLIGSWDAEVVDHLPDGTDRRQSAETHFARVLEGRAVPERWIVPTRASRRGTARRRKSLRHDAARSHALPASEAAPLPPEVWRLLVG